MPAALASVTLLIAVPVMVLFAVWAIVTLARVLFPERLRRRVKVLEGQPVDLKAMRFQVRSRDIVEGIYRQSANMVEEEPHIVEDARQEFEPLFGDLWLRRN